MKIFKINKGFTLAEILITLGIIGVVAALTMPVLIQNHRKSEIETKLKKVYTIMNQAIMLSENENGEREDWASELNTVAGIEKYILPYLKYVDSYQADSYYFINFADGSTLRKNLSTEDWFFHTKQYDKCKTSDKAGKCFFPFVFMQNAAGHFDRNFEPNSYGLSTANITNENLKNHSVHGCNKEASKAYCAKLIQLNGWRIPDDYPIRF